MRFFNRTKFKDIHGRRLCIGDKVKIYIRNGCTDDGIVVGTKENPCVRNSIGDLNIGRCLARDPWRTYPPINKCCGESFAVFEIV